MLGFIPSQIFNSRNTGPKYLILIKTIIFVNDKIKNINAFSHKLDLIVNKNCLLFRIFKTPKI
jgi:hypothetical protein